MPPSNSSVHASTPFAAPRSLTAKWICLDIGETLIDETRVWTTWADVLGVTPLVFHATLGTEIAQGRSHYDALSRFDSDWKHRTATFEKRYGGFQPSDLYPDAIPTIAELSRQGFSVAVIGNQPQQRTEQLASLGVNPDVMAMSDELGVAKPDQAFFAAVLAKLDETDAENVVYVGDRLDNDVLAAKRFGMQCVHIRRGPWGWLLPDRDCQADARITSLSQLLDVVTLPEK